MWETIVGVAIAVGGWYAGHYFTEKASRNQKRRDIAVEHLIVAYRSLVNEIARCEDETIYNKLGAVLLDIQLFGSPSQVKMAIELAKGVSPGATYNLEPLVQSLRNDLRTQLDLAPVSDAFTLVSYRVKK